MVGLVETMLKLHKKSRTLTADSLRLAAPDGCSSRNTPEPSTVSRKPMADMRQIAATDKAIDMLVYELYGLTEDEIAIVEGRAK
ncbi:MAG: hypothetical protein NTX53_09690 [candidate division WOR-3 bacterium]|nr:hypothetical protein [candidate division WOR-3 bacterium]